MPHTSYADRTNAYWTGYFTSRPALKHYVRTMSGYYLVSSHNFSVHVMKLLFTDIFGQLLLV